MAEEKAVRIVKFNGKKEDYEHREEKFRAKAELNDFGEILDCEKVPTKNEYSAILSKQPKERTDEEKDVIQLAQKNRKAYTHLILSMNTSTSRGKVAFRRVKNCKSGDYPEGNAKLAWDRLMSSYAPKSLPSLLKFKRKFENSKLESAEIDPEEWISELEGLTIEIESIDVTSAISERELMVKILNNLPSEYDVVLDGLETRLNNASGTDGLTLEDVREKLSTRYERIKANEEDELNSSKEKAYVAFKFKKQYK